MSIEDLRQIALYDGIEADLCIVGSGPAGWTIAEELRHSGLKIVILESGGLERDAAADALNDTEDLGLQLYNGRARVLGGTSKLWNGRCIPFDAIDYEERPWVPLSGWPVTANEMQPHVHRASIHLGIVAFPDRDKHELQLKGLRAQPSVNPALIESSYWANPPIIDFGERLCASRAANLRVFVHATVTHVNTENGHVDSLEVLDADGGAHVIRARAVVLAAGGVENVRILLNSNRVAPEGVGNEHDVVGRYFMDHPRDFELVARVAPSEARQFRSLFGPYLIDTARGRCEFSHGFKLSPRYQQQAGLLNCAAWPYEVVAEDDPFNAGKRLVAGPRDTAARDAWRVASQWDTVLRGVHARAVKQRIGRKVERIGFLIASEQRPDPESRIQLSSQRDRFGLPTTTVDWRVSEQEVQSQAALANLIASEFQRLGLPQIELAHWVRPGSNRRPDFNDGCHPSGGTRMADDPRFGVVDANCRVHGVAGLYAAGSSVFPTSSHANPTLMIVAMAVRLAKHLMHGVAAEGRQPVETLPRLDAAKRPTIHAISHGTVAAVTGATGFIGRRLVEQLVKLGADVVCFTRQPSAQPPAGSRIQVVELSDPQAVCAAMRGVDLLFHCAYDWDDPDWNLRALRALIQACQVNHCQRMVQVSSFVVYDLPDTGEVTEATPANPATSGYAHTKLALEAELLGATRHRLVAATIIQPTIVYGPQSRPWTLDPVDRLRHGTVVLPGEGEGICAAVYVDDVVSAMILAAVHPKAVGERFLISGPAPVTWRDFYEGLATAVGTRGPEYRPAALIARDHQPVRKALRRVTDPEWAIRRAASIGPLRRMIQTGLKALPRSSREVLTERLYGPEARRNGVVHLPGSADLRFLQGQAVIHSTKARQMLGYVPQFDLSAGMVPVAQYLNSTHEVVLSPFGKTPADDAVRVS